MNLLPVVLTGGAVGAGLALLVRELAAPSARVGAGPAAQLPRPP